MIYAISDLHGHTGTFMEFASTIKDDDFVYVLGDVIDKGDGSLDVLRYIMTHSNFELILGNHEYMFFNLIYWFNRLSEFDEVDDSNMTLLEKRALREDWLYVRERESEAYSVASFNDTLRTYDSYITLSDKEQHDIFEYLKERPLQVELEAGGRKFVLVHAVPNDSDKIRDGILRFNQFDFESAETTKWVWDRKYYVKYKDMIVVAGHNLNPYTFGHSFIECDGDYTDYDKSKAESSVKKEDIKSEILKPFSWACIDCGLAYRDSFKSKLGVLCLDDLSFSVLYSRDFSVDD